MKKFALSILSVFILLGGAFLAVGCQNKVSLSVPLDEVIIFTNDESADNYREKNVDVQLNNSSAGIRVEILSGSDSVRVSSARHKTGNTYSFTIYGEKSGTAEIKISAVEDNKQFHKINVVVNTIMESIELGNNNSTDARSSLFVVKSVQKNLLFGDYFDFKPVTANITDVDWNFAKTGNKILTNDADEEVAKIENGMLLIYNDAVLDAGKNFVELKVSSKLNSEIFNVVRLDVLEGTTINSLIMQDELVGQRVIYENNSPAVSNVKFKLKRNNASLSKAIGQIVVNSNYDLTLKPVVKMVGSDEILSQSEFEDFFSFDITGKTIDEVNNTITYNFSVDAIDRFNLKKFGNFELVLYVGYRYYNFGIDTSAVGIEIESSYAVEKIEVSDSKGDILNNSIVDVFSSYNNSNGFELSALLLPSDVALDTNYYRISFNARQSVMIGNLVAQNPNSPLADIATFTYRGRSLKFSPAGGFDYISEEIKSGDPIYVVASNSIESVLKEVEFDFVQSGEGSQKTSLAFNFFKVSTAENLDVLEESGETIQTRYISSNKKNNATTYRLKIEGIVSLSGLNLKHSENSNFVFSNLTEIPVEYEEGNENYIIVEFTVSLNGIGFEGETNFWFEHVTGRSSEKFLVKAFRPLDAVSIQNGDTQSSNVFINKTGLQSFVDDNGQLSKNINLESESLNKLMIEAGTTLPLITNYQSLSETGLEYLYLSFEDFVSKVKELENCSDEEALVLAEKMFQDGEIDYVANFYNAFGQVPNLLISQLNDVRLSVTDNEFKGFVLAKFNGYDENYRDVSVVRIFALESFYSVLALKSNVSEKLLYTSETLSLNDMERSFVDVTISFRSDDKIPTYTKNLSFFTFNSAKDLLQEQEGNYKNRFYEIGNVQTLLNGKYLRFRIKANSTNLQTVFHDIVTISYVDDYGFKREAEILLEIRNVNRVESVKWVNKTADNEIYLNLTSRNKNEKNFTISTSVMPGSANDVGLSYVYFASGNATALNIQSNTAGQTFNLSIGDELTRGGNGFMFLLPNDMIKNIDGINQILLYHYETNEAGEILKDEEGFLLEDVIYVPLNQLERYFDVIVNGGEIGSKKVSNFFLNNDGKKIFNKDVILKIRVIIADGLSEGTAIRIYNEQGLKNIDTAKYYEIMNNLTLNNWRSFESLSGMLFGSTSTITLNMVGQSESFVNILNGTIKDLIFTGLVTENNDYVGFVANVNDGLVENVSVDVYYDNKDDVFKSSVLTVVNGSNVGGLVGRNLGEIVNSFNFGLTIDAQNSTYAGGLVGENVGLIERCGVEFYKFNNTSEPCNYILVGGSGTVGGIAGTSTAEGVISQTYTYAYPLINGGSYTSLFKGASIINLFVGQAQNGANVRESFAYLGDLTSVGNGTFTNSYYVYNTSASNVTKNLRFLTSDVTLNTISLNEFDIGNTSGYWMMAIERLNVIGGDIWETTYIDSEVNFGFMHLKHVSPSVAVDIDNVSIADNTEPLKSLKVGEDNDNMGILFLYSVSSNITDEAELSALVSLNTISLADLFNVSVKQSRSLLLTSLASNISVSTTSIRLLNKEMSKISILVHSKMDLTKSKEFVIVVENKLPEISTMIGEYELLDNQIVMLQKGKTLSVVHNLDDMIYLNGKGYASSVNKNDYSIGFVLNDGDESEDAFVSVRKSNNSIVLEGKQSVVEDETSKISSFLNIDALDTTDNQKYLEAIRKQRTRNFEVSVYNGATSLLIDNATNLAFKPSEFAKFDVLMLSDNEQDNLMFKIKLGNMEWSSEARIDAQNASFEINNNLMLDVSWSYVQENLAKRYTVIVKVNKDFKHLVDKTYDFEIFVNALSQRENEEYMKTIGLTLETQPVENVKISTYSVESRRVNSSILYFRPSNEIINTIMPSSDMFLVVSVRPEYAQMTHFELTYESPESQNAVSVSKLSYNQNYGYYINSIRTTYIENGVRVTLNEEDKKGTGDFYFRVYISSNYTKDSKLKFKVTFFNNEEILRSVTHDMQVEYMQEADVKVNGVSTYLMAKGSSAKVTVTVGLEQRLSSLYLQSNGSNISLSSWTEEVVGSERIYTANLMAYLNSTVIDGNGVEQKNGVFYVSASVERIVNGQQEIKVGRAVVNLLDFTIDESGISVDSSGSTSIYNGKTYDVLYSYIGATTNLSFNYPLLPEKYEYDVNNSSEIAEYERIMKERNQFANKNTYANEAVDYYINYELNSQTAMYHELTLKEQLSYARNEDELTDVYNPSYGIKSNDFFTLTEEQVNGSDGLTQLVVTGKNAGRQLMKLETVVMFQGQVVRRIPYYFLIVVEVWNDAETPTQIFTAQEFVDYATKSEQPKDYILMNDIVLEEYNPLSTELFRSLDGNGFTIHLNSFAPQTGSSLELALFSNVAENTTLKNVRVNVYNGGQIKANVAVGHFTNINVAGFALTNNGVIYNCEVVSFYSEKQKEKLLGDTGLVVKYMDGENTDFIQLTEARGVDSTVSGFVGTNNASIINSRVGGTGFKYLLDIAGQQYLSTFKLGTFTIEGQGDVAGFVGSNTGAISASYASQMQIYNNKNSNVSKTAGFALKNSSKIQGSYIEGVGEIEDKDKNKVVENKLTNISSMGYVAGFIYENAGLVKNCYANIAIENIKTKPSFASGFVYKNESDGEVTLCYTACVIAQSDINQMPFSGVDEKTNSLNLGKISFSYFYSATQNNNTNEAKLTSGVTPVNGVVTDPENGLYGFSFASSDDSYDGIWTRTENGVTLVSANKIAFSNRYAVVDERTKYTYIYYNRSIRDAETLLNVNLSYGSINNPIIIRNAYDFAVATGNATNKEVSSYKEYYNEHEVFGSYRIVNNIDFNDEDVDQNSSSEGKAKLTTTEKTFSGLLDGNGFTISNINLGSSKPLETYGLFGKLNDAVVMNLDLIVDSVHNSQASVVGTLAGVAYNSRIMSISLSPSSGDKENTSIHGKNIVGGVVGMLFGESHLHDINVRDIEVYSSDFGNKDIESNYQYISQLRGLLKDGASLEPSVSHLSYAGAIAGFVDVYNLAVNERVKFMQNMKVSEFDIVAMHVNDSVNIYAEVAGGLFGYVGDSTYVYDATIELDADMALSKPSYIIAKNLYSGGIIGENYGGLFAVHASYSTELQLNIEKSEHDYYSGSNISAERGQQTIFTFTESDSGFKDKYDDPLYVGGLVGYMGSGFINVAYSKLNVISRSDRTIAVGGIIGYLANDDNSFQLTALKNNPKVNLYLQDVYASGDLYVENSKGWSGGIIGAVNTSSSVVAMKNVLAVNNYSYNVDKLLGDVAPEQEKDSAGNVLVQHYISDKHYMLIGKASNGSSDTALSVYLIKSSNSFFLSNGVEDTSEGSLTVGGYNQIKIGTGDSSVYISLNVMGFGRKLNSNMAMFVEHIGQETMAGMPSAYIRLSQYFIENGWDENYWVHTQDELFPHIELLPKLNVKFWDVFNTQEVLQAMNSGESWTIIVRGKVSPSENDNTYTDIDLTTDENKFSPIKNFHGRLVSYYEYMSEELPELTPSDKGGHTRDSRPGIIINQSMFEDFNSTNSSVEGVTFYLCESIGENEINYSLVQNPIVNATTFKKVNLVYNTNVSLKTIESDLINVNGKQYVEKYAGLIVPYASTTSFIDINVVMRGNSSITINNIRGNYSQQEKVYVGLLAGYVVQNGSFSSISVSGINVLRESVENDSPIDVTFSIGELGINNDGYDEFYAGLYAGRIFRGASNTSVLSRLNVGLNALNSVNLNLTGGSENSAPNAYVGGFVGEIEGVDSAKFTSNEIEKESNGVLILQRCNFNELYAGLGFGRIINSPVSIAKSGQENEKINGGIQQVGNVSSKLYNLGGIAGYANSQVTVQGLSVEFNVGKVLLNDNEFEKPNYEEIFSKASYNYKTVEKNELSPFVLYGNSNDCVGGIIGRVEGSEIRLSDSCDIKGVVDVAVDKDVAEIGSQISVGGMLGQTTGGFQATISCMNNLNISVSEIGVTPKQITAYVGGMIGKIVNVSEGTGTIQINSNFANYSGTVISNVKKLIFGGGIGFVERTDFLTKSIQISGVAFGGAVRVYGENIDGGNLIVGGVVGEFNLGTSSTSKPSESELKYSISNCYSYGDVFVNYLPFENEMLNWKLSDYSFGGIVGVASFVKISKCYSIMTSFNSRVSTGSTAGVTQSSIGNYAVGSIVGANSENCYYEDNGYSSSVCLAKQEEENNIDMPYGISGSYSGYTSKFKMSAGEENTIESEIVSSVNILEKFRYFASGDLKFGNKLKPYIWNRNSSRVSFEDGVKSVDNTALDNTHNISWIALSENVDLTNSKDRDAIADVYFDVAFVGNGRTITVSDIREKSLGDEDVANEKAFGGLVNQMGKQYKIGNAGEVTVPNFNLISGLILNMDVESADFNKETGVPASSGYGAVAGKSYGNSFIYGVGVGGKMSVGGKNNQLKLGGIVGDMQEGFINECYVDAHISYRATGNSDQTEGGYLSGVANLRDKNTTIKSTYSSGLLESYVSVNISTFVRVFKEDDSKTTNDIIDCYSISQTKQNNILGDAISKIEFINNATKVQTFGEVLHGCYSLNATYNNANDINKTGLKTVDQMALRYNESASTKKTDSLLKDGHGALSSWYFSPYINYGYASHGFGYLKNVTTYTREQNEENKKAMLAKTTVIPEYEYTPVSYLNILKYGENKFFENGNNGTNVSGNWYLGVPNRGKFEQMIDTVSGTYSKDYKFVLKYGFDMNGFNNSKLGEDIGIEGMHFVFDGGNNSLDFSYTSSNQISKALFGVLIGDIENLKITNLNTSSNATVAISIKGDLTNLSVSGNVSGSGRISGSGASSIAGGVVGRLEGSATAIDSLVNINSNAAVVGGIAGHYVGSTTTNNKTDVHTISYSSNHGQIIAKGSGTISEAKFKPYIKRNGMISFVSETSAELVVGGIVGMSTGGNIENSYNNNAVFANYTTDNNKKSIAGGVVGYANNTTVKQSHNTGMVAAGNYDSRVYSFAGGIVGYGSRGTNISGCVNDGAVEAINKVTVTNNQKIELGKLYEVDENNIFGNEVNDSTKGNGNFSKTPTKVGYHATMTYFANKERQVYAFGIGFVGDTGGKIENCNTSTDNIRNDGVIGEFKQTKDLIFDRDKILDNKNGNERLNFYGSFNMQKMGEKQTDYAISGIDSYGFTTRIYKDDEITRIYTGKKPLEENGVAIDYSSELETSGNYRAFNFFVDGVIENGVATNNNYFYSNGDWSGETNRDYLIHFDYNGNGSFTNEMDLSNAAFNGRFTFNSDSDRNEMLRLQAVSKYYASVEFEEYDQILLNMNVVGFVNASEIDNDGSSAKVSNDVSEKIQNLESLKENTKQVGSISVNGQKVALVNNQNNFKAVLAPYNVRLRFEFDLENTLNNTDFKFKVSDTARGAKGDIGVQYFEYEIESSNYNESNKITHLVVNFDVYFAEMVEASSVNVSVSYDSFGEVVLSKNNFVNKNNQTYIYLISDMTPLSIIPKDSVENFNKEDYVIKLDGQEITDYRVEVENDIVCLVLGRISNLSDYKNLNITKIIKSYYRPAKYYAISNTNDEEKVRFENLNNSLADVTATFIGFEEKRFADVGFTPKFEDNKINRTEIVGKTIDLSPFAKTEGVELIINNHILTYSSVNGWSVEESTEIADADSYMLTVDENGILTVEMKNGIEISENCFDDFVRLFEGVVEVADDFVFVWNDIEQTTEEISGKKIDLSKLVEESNDRIAFGNNLYGFNYSKANGWQIESGKENVNGLEFRFVGNILYIDGNDLDAINGFITQFSSMTLYRNKSSIGSEERIYSTTNKSETESDLTLNMTYSLKNVGDFVGGNYNGNNFDEENGDRISTETSTYFGLNFYTKKVTYSYKLESASVINEGEAFAYELKANGNLFKQGYLLQNDEVPLVTSSLDVDLDNIEFVIHRNAVTRPLSDGQILDNNLRKFMYGEEGDLNKLMIGFYSGTDNGISKDGLLNGENIDYHEFFEKIIIGQNYIETNCIYGEGGNKEEYIYRIYDTGAISVEYILSTGKEETDDFNDDTRRKYILYEQKVYRLGITEYALENYEDEDGKNHEGETRKDYDYSQVIELTSSDKFSHFYSESFKNKTIKVDIILAYMDEKNIYPIRNNLSGTLKVLGYETVEEKSEFEVNLELLSGKDEEFELSSYEKRYSSNFEYKLQDAVKWNKSDCVISTNSYKEQIYQYRYNRTVERQSSTFTTPVTSESNLFKTIILNENITVSNSFGELKKTLIGNDCLIKFIGKDEQVSLFGEVSFVKDVNVAGIISMNNISSYGERYGFAEISNESVISNIGLYGTIRNILNKERLVVSPVKGSSVEKLNSYMSICGLNAKTDVNDIETVLKDTIKNSKNIIIAGNGSNGENGRDGLGFIASEKNGKDGGDGGSISVSEGFSGFVKLGIGGQGGYGGNGLHGYFEEKALGGGGAGRHGASKEIATLTGTANNKIKTRTINGKQYSGNGGNGGFGRIVMNNYYTSGGGGGLGIVGGAGDEKTWLYHIGGEDCRQYGLAGTYDYITKMGIGIPEDDYMIRASYRDTYLYKIVTGYEFGGSDFMYGNMKGIYRDYDSLSEQKLLLQTEAGEKQEKGGTSGGVGAGQVVQTKYYTMKVVRFYINGSASRYYMNNSPTYESFAWTSGETINGAGSYRAATND